MIEGPRIENGRAMQLTGLSCTTMEAIVPLWAEFSPHIGRLPGAVGHVTYGVVNGTDAGFFYLAAMETDGSARPPGGFERLDLPARRYAIFEHAGHISTMHETFIAANAWLKASGRERVAAPAVERYGDGFDPHRGTGDVEIWFPIR